MVNDLVVYSLSCQPSRWIYQPCKASVPGLQLLLIRLARTRIRLAFQRISCIFGLTMTTAVQCERGGKLAWPSLSRRPQSPLHLHCNGKGTKKTGGAQIFSPKSAIFEGYFSC